LTDISGVEFGDCWRAQEAVVIDGVTVNIINLDSLKVNKRASGRLKDMDDLDNLP